MLEHILLILIIIIIIDFAIRGKEVLLLCRCDGFEEKSIGRGMFDIDGGLVFIYF
jgi:hypothetical protein